MTRDCIFQGTGIDDDDYDDDKFIGICVQCDLTNHIHDLETTKPYTIDYFPSIAK